MKNYLFLLFISVFLLIASSPHRLIAYSSDRLQIGIISGKPDSLENAYPVLWRQLARFLQTTTTIEPHPVFATPVTPKIKKLEKLGIVFLLGDASFKGFSSQEREILKRWLILGGGTLVIVNTESAPSSGPDALVRKEVSKLFPDKTLGSIPWDSALFRSFYLVKSVGGLTLNARFLEGIAIGERYAIIYSPNDILAPLIKDSEGSYLFRCYPGGEKQRMETVKLVTNVFLYALTGTYKKDVIHMPFIERKLRRK
ncbi:DUF4159 domain-containing protein [Elusimicrobiota bacterium]